MLEEEKVENTSSETEEPAVSAVAKEAVGEALAPTEPAEPQQPSGEKEKMNFKRFMGIIWNNIKWFFKHPNTIYCLKRIGGMLISLFLVATFVFLLLRMVPKSGYYDVDTMRKMTDLQKANYMMQIDKKYGFDKPLIVQLFSFYWDILPIPREYVTKTSYSADYSELIPRAKEWYVIYLGTSQICEAGKTVTSLLGERMGISFGMSIVSAILTYIIAYPLGVIMAKNKGKWPDKAGNVIIVISYAIPSLVFYFIFWKLFLTWGFGGTYRAELSYFIAPVSAMVLLSIPGTAMWVRRYMVDQGDADYVKFARSKGLSETRIMYTHVLRNAIVPLIRNFPAAFIGAIIGSYYIENVWSIPGTGKLLVQALNVERPDNQLVQGLAIIYAALSMVSFLVGDLVTVFVDPRIKLGKD